jgi:Tol biopolymer transport system component
MTGIGKIGRRKWILGWTAVLVMIAGWAVLSGMERTEPPAAGNMNGKKLATLDPATYIAKSLVFSTDGRHAVWLRRTKDGRTQLLLDGTPGPAFDGAFEPPVVLSTDGRHVAYRVDDKKGARQFVINDGTVGPPFDHLLGMPVFSPDDRHLAYAGERKGTYQVVFDGKPSPDYELVGHLKFSPDSKKFAYAAQKDKRRFVIVDGVRGPSFDDVYPTGFSPDSRHLLYYATQGHKQRLVVDNRAGAEYDAIGPVRFDPLKGGKTPSIGYVALLGHDLIEVAQPLP